jgi:hypothetical protein
MIRLVVRLRQARQASKQATKLQGKGKAKAGIAALLVRATQRSYLLSDCYC